MATRKAKKAPKKRAKRTGGGQKKTSARARPKKVPVKGLTAKDVVITFLDGGAESVAKLLEAGAVSRASVRRAVTLLAERGRDGGSLETLIGKRNGRGRAAPSAGQRRVYRAQALAKGSPFLRVPLATLGISKGGAVAVAFDSGRIVLSPAAVEA